MPRNSTTHRNGAAALSAADRPTRRRRKPAPIVWPADAVERRPLASLIPYARNARTHSDGQVAAIAASIREWGWTMPLLIDESDELIAGHGRVLAAELLKLTDVPVMIARGWSAAKIRAYRIADNKLALLSGWDDELLGLEFADLRDLGVDLELTGFTVAELDQLWADENDPNREWEGMPEFVQQSRMAFRSIIVHLAGPEDVEKFAKLVKQPVGEKTRWIWYPPQPRAQHENKQFVTGEAAE